MADIIGTDSNDTLLGAAAADSIRGLGGNDYIDGGDGRDVIEGGDGDDLLFGGLGEDTIYGGGGNDFLVAAPDGAPGIEQLNRDALAGQDGNDTYLVSGNQRIGDDPSAGFDTVIIRTTGGFALTAGAEVEVIIAQEARATTAMTLRGNEYAQTIVGNYGNNILDAGSAAFSAVDTLIGLLGDDQYEVIAGTVIRETAGEGNDSVLVRIGTYALASGVSIETMNADAGNGPVNLIGNDLAQVLTGNDGANILSSGGGSGADTMNGGAGDDIYRVFQLGDVVNDTSGFDTVYASGTSYFLSTTAQIEYLSSASQSGTEAIYLVGNASSQVVAGNYGDNILDGGGSGGADTLIGLRGNDIYRVYQQADIVREIFGEGNDAVFTSTNYQLRDGLSIEGLSTENQRATGGAVEYILRGNEFAQTIVGNDASNTIDGRGGNDTLIGRGGVDIFAFTTALDGVSNVDMITDFATFDKIGLATDIFGAVTDGGIGPGEFMSGTAALDADDRLIYDPASGRLSYDADGIGVGTAVQFATLTPNLSLSSFDFIAISPVASAPAT